MPPGASIPHAKAQSPPPAAHQQTSGMEQIGQAMTAMQQATAQALSSTRQAERAARDLHDLAQSLQQTISTYRL